MQDKQLPCVKLMANVQQGKTYFSITTKEGVEKYLADRQKDVDSGLIVSGRFKTINTHLQHWLDFIGRDEKLKNLERGDSQNYYHWRTTECEAPPTATTILNEQSSINACIKYLFHNKEVNIDAFEFKKLPRTVVNNDDIRRATFTNIEYRRFAKAMRTYCKDAPTEDEKTERKIMQLYYLIASNSGMRVGEQRQLRWSDVEIVRKTVNNVDHVLARITVRAETSKVRKTRIFLCRGGKYFERLKALTNPEKQSEFVFSVDGGETSVKEKTILKHFYPIVKLAQIDDVDGRGIVPYSLRHFMITNRIMSGVSLKQVADMCGTSIIQIERTYFHINDETRLASATADYKIVDGAVTVI